MNRKTIEKVVSWLYKRDYFNEQAFYTILENIVERTLDLHDNVDEAIENVYNAIDDELIYYEDQWTVLRHYFIDPREAIFANAIEHLYDDVCYVLTELDNTLQEMRKWTI